MDPDDRLAAFFDTSHPRISFNDEQINAVARLLARSSRVVERMAARSPRTYIVLRIIGRLDILPRLLSDGFGDGWFPITQRGLPGFIDPQAKNEIYRNQRIILTKSLDLENGQHCNYDNEEQRPFEIQSYIGSGSFGQVRIIESRVSYKQYALKTIRRRIAFGTQSREIMTKFNDEMRIMKRLNHRHVVRYVGSYTDRNDLGLVMSPVANCDLEAYLKEACTSSGCHPTLRTFFGCLASALSYLHDEGIKHRDIKPKNILVHRANVLLADFGISREFLDTTSGPTTATQRYCAPEVAAYEGRNASADVWSLGCVFLEMQNALYKKDLSWVKTYYETHGTSSTHFHANPQATEELLGKWQTAVDLTQAEPLAWIKPMLTLKRTDRPTAAEIMNEITASDTWVGFMYSCDQCCYSASDPESVRIVEGGIDHIPEDTKDASGTHSKVEPLREDLTRSNDVLPGAKPHTNEATHFASNARKDLTEIAASVALTKLSYAAAKRPEENSRQGAKPLSTKLGGSTQESEQSLHEIPDPYEPAEDGDVEKESSGEHKMLAKLEAEQTSKHPPISSAEESQKEGYDLYQPGERLTTGSFTFSVHGQPIAALVTIPEIVVYCAGNTLRAESMA
ncbi:dual specificity mitogen-activated protein kinase kinase 1 [Stagonosporopsis vannaccii]|nr:dual specificity mitogen-activated protein kinase kinase 1 [Stagonosporopsis vannaccii]